MSGEINKCVECGCRFLNPPKGIPKVKHWFTCDDCGTTYIQRKETGLWYEEDDYHDRFDEIDEYFSMQKIEEEKMKNKEIWVVTPNLGAYQV